MEHKSATLGLIGSTYRAFQAITSFEVPLFPLQNRPLQLLSNSFTGDRHNCLNRCVSPRMGSSLETLSGIWSLVTRGETKPHQHRRARRNILWVKTLSPAKHTCPCANGQQDSNSIPKRTHSPSLNILAILSLKYTMQKNILISAEYLPGKENIKADELACRITHDAGDWRLCPTVFQKVFRVFQLVPSVDLFASRRSSHGRAIKNRWRSTHSLPTGVKSLKPSSSHPLS